jgi:hypothetical protein
VTSPTVEIRPEVAIYSAFARLNYKSWYALAEFVDNSLQSYQTTQEQIKAADGALQPLRVTILLGEDFIEVKDNAGGIAWRDFPRAFLPASPPPDASGLSEYGLGLKAAACWFSKRWSVRTKAVGEPVERTITFDVPTITATHLDRLPIDERAAPATSHYTILTLENLNVRPRARTVDKIKRHLASIYRVFIRDGTLELQVDTDFLEYLSPELLEAPYFLDPGGSPRKWRREFSLQLDETHRIWGWAGILKRASVANAGLAVFRRQRLIEGSYGEAYRPEVLFRKSNTFTYQRLIGEVFVEGFTVSHTKDGIQWADWEEDLLRWLRNELDREPLPLLKQAEGFRVGRTRPARSLEHVATDTQTVLGQRVPPLVDEQLGSPVDDAPLAAELPDARSEARREVVFRLEHAGQEWHVHIDLIADEAIYPWLDLAGVERGAERSLRIRVNTAHPFMVRFATPTGSELPALIRLAAGFALAETTARAIGVDRAGTIRRNLNQLLREALASPAEDIEDDPVEDS